MTQHNNIVILFFLDSTKVVHNEKYQNKYDAKSIMQIPNHSYYWHKQILADNFAQIFEISLKYFGMGKNVKENINNTVKLPARSARACNRPVKPLNLNFVGSTLKRLSHYIK